MPHIVVREFGYDSVVIAFLLIWVRFTEQRTHLE
jgi:hypothetical protein